MSTPKSLYRQILRELRLASPKSTAERNSIIPYHFRSILQQSSATSGRASGNEGLIRALGETRDFLRSSRIHAELLKRYNPIADMTEQEKIHATANRVGLNTPIEYKAD